MLSQFSKTIKLAMKSTEEERSMLRARSAAQRFPVLVVSRLPKYMFQLICSGDNGSTHSIVEPSRQAQSWPRTKDCCHPSLHRSSMYRAGRVVWLTESHVYLVSARRPPHPRKSQAQSTKHQGSFIHQLRKLGRPTRRSPILPNRRVS